MSKVREQHSAVAAHEVSSNLVKPVAAGVATGFFEATRPDEVLLCAR